MTCRIEVFPVVPIATTGLGMLKFRRDLSQRTQHKAETQHIRSRQAYRRFVHYQVIIEHQVNIECSRRITERVAIPAGGILNLLQLCMDFNRSELTAESDDHIEEFIAVETIRLTSINGRFLEPAESFFQFFERKGEIFPWVDIAADTQIDYWHIIARFSRDESSRRHLLPRG